MYRGSLWLFMGAGRRRSFALLWTALLVFSLIAQSVSIALPSSALGVHDEGLFELDGNALNDAAAGDDWEDVYGNASGAAQTFFAEDPYEDPAYTGGLEDDTFTGGSTKDDIDFPSWLWKYFKSSQAKNDITHAFAAAYDAPNGDIITYFGLAKYEADGNNYAGFWFLKDDFSRPATESGPSGTHFIGEHVVGDILVLANYTNGGELADFDIFKWVGTGGDANAAGTLDTVASGVPCAGGSSGDDACGATNSEEIDSPWDYQGRDSNGNPIDPNRMGPATFFEGGINLTALGLDEGCFSSFVAETRSSQSVDATLTDFVSGSFSFCVTPELRTQVQQDGQDVETVDLSESFTDHVAITGNKGAAEGTVDFYVCGPTATATECAKDDAAFVSTETLDGGGADSDAVTPTESGFYCFYVEYTPAEGSKYLAESHANATTECVEVLPPDVEIVKTAEDDSISAGDTIDFDVTVSNNGDGDAYGVEVDDELPAGFDWTIDAANSDAGWSIDANDHLVFGPATLDANGGTSSVRIHAATEAADCGLVENEAFLTITNGTGDDDDATVDINCAVIEIEKSTSDDSISAGDTIDFDVTVSNNGDGDAYGVEVDDELPAGFDWTVDAANSDAGWSIVDGHLVFGPATILAGGSSTVRITSPTDADDCGEVNNIAYVTTTNDGSDDDDATVTILCPDVAVVKEAVLSPVSAGDPIAFDITVSNIGDGNAYGVALVDELPDGITWSVDNTDQCEITGSGDDQVLSCDLGDILVGGDPITVRVSGITPDGVCLSIPNTAVVDAENESNDEKVTENNESTDTVLVACPDVAVLKEVVESPVSAGDRIAFDITVSNVGNGDAHDVTLVDELPDGIDWSVNNTEQCEITGSGNDQVLSCDFGDMLAGAPSITVRISGVTDAADCGEVPNTAVVDASNEPDTTDYTTNNESTDTGEVLCPDVTVVKEVVESPVSAGDPIAFDITVSNIGDGDAYGVTLVDELPDGIAWTENSDQCGITGSGDDQVLSCDFGDILVGDDPITVRVSGETDAADCGQVPNTATVDAGNEPDTAEYTGNNESTDSGEVLCAEIELTKTADDPEVLAGDGIGFTITVSNNGEGDAYGTVVNDPLPTDGGVSWTIDAVNSDEGWAIADGTLTWGPGTLPAGQSISVHIISPTTEATCGDVDNTASVTTDNDGSDEDSSTVTVYCPDIEIVKTAGDAADGEEYVTTPGGVIFTYVVTNSGTIDLVNVVVVDDNATPVDTSDDVTLDCPKDELAAGESMTCTATLPVGFGVRTNVAEVTGNPSIDTETEVSDEDDAVVRVPDLTIEKSFTGNSGGTTPDGQPEAKAGDVLTYTLAYDLTDGPVTNGVITDTLPLGLNYVVGSALGNDEFTFVAYDAGTRTLTWTAAVVTKDATVSYEVLVDEDAAELIQPLINVATIDSDETVKDDDDANVFVEPLPLAETGTPNPTLPPTSSLDQVPSQPGADLLLLLIVLAGVMLIAGYFAPTPARASRRDRREG